MGNTWTVFMTPFDSDRNRDIDSSDNLYGPLVYILGADGIPKDGRINPTNSNPIEVNAAVLFIKSCSTIQSLSHTNGSLT
jgi:hypothetical protein